MLKTILSVASLLLSYGLLLLANGMLGTLLGLRGKLEGFSTEIIGLIMAGYSLGLLIGAIRAVSVVASVGHIRAFAAFASIMSVAVLAHVLWIDPVFWFVLRTIAGFCLAGMILVTESWINERATNKTRGSILSLYMITNYLGAGIGQLMITIADPAKFELFAIASIIFSIALVPILLTRAKAPTPSTPERMEFRELFRISPVGVTGTVIAAIISSSFNAMGPIFAKDIGMTVENVSLFMASVVLGGMLLQIPVGRISDRFDRRTVLVFSCIGTIIGGIGIILTSESGTVSYIFMCAGLYGGFCYTIYPVASAQIHDLADPEKRVQVASSLLIAFGVGAIIGPIISSQLMGRVGPNGIFILTASFAALLILFTLYRMIRRKPTEKEKASFIPRGVFGFSGKQVARFWAENAKKKSGN